MKRIATLTGLIFATLAMQPAQAGEIDAKAVLGAGVGAAAGAAVGSAVGGREGAIIGGGIGGAAGAAVATSQPKTTVKVQERVVTRDVVYVQDDRYEHDNGRHLGHHKHKHKHKNGD